MEKLLKAAHIDIHNIPTDKSLIFAFDPGKKTGWACVTQDLKFYAMGEMDFDCVAPGFHSLLLRMVNSVLPSSLVLIEDYTITPRPVAHATAKMTLKIIGELQFVTRLFEVPTTFRLSSERQLASRQLLSKHGLWAPGLKDGNAAVQHLFTYLITTNRFEFRTTS